MYLLQRNHPCFQWMCGNPKQGYIEPAHCTSWYNLQVAHLMEEMKTILYVALASDCSMSRTMVQHIILSTWQVEQAPCIAWGVPGALWCATKVVKACMHTMDHLLGKLGCTESILQIRTVKLPAKLKEVYQKVCSRNPRWRDGDILQVTHKQIVSFRWLNARLQFLHCISNGDTAVLH